MSTYNLVNEAIVEIQMLGRLAEQRVRNVFHYTYVGETDSEGLARLTEFEDSFHNLVATPILGVLSEDYELESISVQAILPTRYRAVLVDHGELGGVESPALPPTTAIVVRRTTFASGKRFQGRIFLPGVPTSSVEDGQLTDEAMDDMAGLADVLATEIAAAVPEKTLRPIIHYQDLITGLDVVINSRVQRILRVQRRREIGVGE